MRKMSQDLEPFLSFKGENMFHVSEDILEEIKNYDEKILQYEMLGAIEPTTFLIQLTSLLEQRLLFQKELAWNFY